ncbi:MAG: CHRD domain-containing protein [Hyphomicrobiales bacterium]
MDARKLLLAAATLALFSSFNSAPASAQATPLFAVLNGGNECNSTLPPPGPVCRKGDPDGVGSATILFPTTTSLCFGILVDNLANAPGTTFAHIHGGVSGINGAILVTLAPPPVAPAFGNPGASSGCVSGVSSTLVAAIRSNPTAFYINVHNAGFPDGAVRGQLF